MSMKIFLNRHEGDWWGFLLKFPLTKKTKIIIIKTKIDKGNFSLKKSIPTVLLLWIRFAVNLIQMVAENSICAKV